MLWYDTSKNTVATPMTSATTYRCHICSTPSHHSSGSDRQGDGAHGVRPDHHVALAHAVDPGTRRQPDHEERGDIGGVQHADLELGRVEDQDGEHGDRELR